MQRRTALLLAVVLVLSLIPISHAAAANDYSWIKVKLTTNNATSLTVYASGSYFIKENGAQFTGGTISVRSNGDGTLTLSHSSLGDVYTGSSLSIMRADVSRTAGYLKLNRYCYLGHFNLKYVSGYIRVVNEVPLAQYLYGVVGHEMSNTFPLEALKAQAIAAKCYVLSQIATTGDYYIGDTSAEQVYKGYNSTYTQVIQAVDSTLCEVLTVNGNLLRTYYAASNGGETMLPTQAWPSKSLNSNGYAVSLDEFDLSNAYSKMEIIQIPVGTSGSINPALMNMLLYKASQATGITMTQIDQIYSVSMDTPKYAGQTRNLSQCNISYLTSCSGSNAQTINLTFYTSELETWGVVNDLTLRMYWGEQTSSGYYNIYHVRYGHGVGLSQRGAQARASAGHSYRDILSFYYPGASVSTISVSAPENPVNNKTAPTGNYVTALTTGNVRMRSGPGTSHGSITTVPRGSAIYVYYSENGWAYAVYDKYTGYVSEKYVSYPNGTPAPTVEPTATPASQAPDGVIAFGEVNGSGVNFRSGPSTSYTSITRLGKGTTLDIYDQISGWYLAKTANGTQGYMIATYVSITGYPAAASDADAEQEATATPTPAVSPTASVPAVLYFGKCTATGVNFRTGPATSYTSLGKLDRNDEIRIYGVSGSWYYGEVEGVVGYVSGGYIVITAAATNTPPATATASPTATATADPYTTVQTGILNAGNVKLRIGPDTSYARLKALDKDTGVYILGFSGDWYYVLTGGQKGYVFGKYISITGTARIDASGNPQSTASPSSGSAGAGVTTGSVYLRKGPDKSYESIKILRKGTSLTIYSLTDGWYKVKLSDGTAGYVSSKYVNVTHAYVAAEGTSGGEETKTSIGIGITTNSVNFRQGPSTSAKKFSLLSKGESVTVFALKDGWYEVEYKGTRGYLYAKYVAVTKVEIPATQTNTGGGITAGDGLSSTVTVASGTVNSKVNFRNAPSTVTGNILDTLAKGTPLEILGQCGDWYYVLKSGTVGFVSSSYVNVTSSGTVGVPAVNATIRPQSCVTSAAVNMRTGVGTKNPVISLLSKGTSLTVYYVRDGWCFVKCGGAYGYVIDTYVAVS